MISLDKFVYDPKAKSLTILYNNIITELDNNRILSDSGRIPEDCKIYGNVWNFLEIKSHVTGIVKNFIYLPSQKKSRDDTTYGQEFSYWRFYPAEQTNHRVSVVYVVDNSLHTNFFDKVELKPWNQVIKGE